MRYTHTIGVPCLLMIGFVMSCTENDSDGLIVESIIAPQPPACTIDPRGQLDLATGVLDIHHPNRDIRSIDPTAEFASNYWLAPRLSNNLITAQSQQSYKLGNEGVNYNADTFGIQIIGYAACLSREQSDAPYRTCSEISDAVNYFVTSGNGFVLQGTLAADVVPIMPVAQLSTYLGGLDSLTAAGEWLVVRFRALGRTQAGEEVKSSEYRFPILVCDHCRSCPTGCTPDFTNVCSVYQDSAPSCTCTTP